MILGIQGHPQSHDTGYSRTSQDDPLGVMEQGIQGHPQFHDTGYSRTSQDDPLGVLLNTLKP